MMLFWIIVGAGLIVLGLLIVPRGGGNLGPGLITIGVVVLLFLAMSPVRGEEAHGHTHAGAVGAFYQNWMMPDNQDCAPAEAKLENGRWLARRLGETGSFTPVPHSKIEQDRDSPDGRNHLCARRDGFGGLTVFCFLPAFGG